MLKIVNGVEVALDEDEIASIRADEEALKYDVVRNQRNTLLSESDAYALSDRITDAWIVYRQALRDVPAQTGFPNDINWPTKP
jgi:hypothetical protein